MPSCSEHLQHKQGMVHSLYSKYHSFFGDVYFSEYFCTITIFSLYGEYVVVRFPLPGGVFSTL